MPLPASDTVVVAAIAAGAGASALVDLRTGRIPNPLTGTIALMGLALAAAGLSGHTLAAAAAGGVIGFLLMLPGHLLGATGAGDVKLMAALGTLLGPGTSFRAFLFTAVAGGLLAAGHAWHRGRLQTTLGRTARLMAAPVSTKVEIDGAAAQSRFAYGPAIAVGALAAALMAG